MPLPPERNDMKITSSFDITAILPNIPKAEDLKKTTMLYQCDWEAAKSHTAYDPVRPLDMLVHALPDDWLLSDVLIDTRVHMLMPGWYPCIPGWHHDAVPRTRPDGQPDYSPGGNRSEHLLMILGDDIAGTEFATGTAEFTEPSGLPVVYQHWHPEVEQAVASGILQRHTVKPGELVRFDDRTFHKGVAATGNGWRWFVRISRFFDAEGNHIRVAPRNEVRHQAQVYMDNPFAGW